MLCPMEAVSLRIYFNTNLFIFNSIRLKLECKLLMPENSQHQQLKDFNISKQLMDILDSIKAYIHFGADKFPIQL